MTTEGIIDVHHHIIPPEYVAATRELRIGEFKEYGFPVSIRLSPTLSSKACDEFWDAFLTELIGPRNLAYGGREEGFVMRFGSGSATEADRAAVSDWLRARPGVERGQVDG